MSVEWYKFRLREQVDPDSLREMIALQSGGFRKAVNLPHPGEEVSESERSAAIQQYLKNTTALLPFVSFVAQGQEVDSNNIAFIAFNDIFPHEWREEAKSTILPRQLPALLEKWQTYAQDIRMGYFDDFQYRLFMYEDFNGYYKWAELFREFHEEIVAAGKSEEEWTRGRAVQQTLEEFRSDPVLPPVLEIPAYDPEARELDLQPETRAIFEDYKRDTERLMHQIIAWNRVVPEARKMRIPTFIPVQVRMRQRIMASREWLHPFFEWCTGAVEEGCGLFLAA